MFLKNLKENYIIQKYYNIINDPNHLLHKIIKKIDKKDINSFKKEFLKEIPKNDFRFLNIYKSYNFYKKVNFDIRIDNNDKILWQAQKYTFWNETFWLIENFSNNLRHVLDKEDKEITDKDVFFIKWFWDSEHSNTLSLRNFSSIYRIPKEKIIETKHIIESLENKDYLFSEERKDFLIRNEIIDFLTNNDKLILNLIKYVIEVSFLRTKNSLWNFHHENEIQRFLDLINTISEWNLNFSNFYWLDLEAFNVSDLSMDNSWYSSYSEKEKLTNSILNTAFENINYWFFLMLKRNLTEEELLFLLKIREFYNIWETYNVLIEDPSCYSKYDNFIYNTLIKEYNIKEQPDFLVNSYTNKIKTISINDITEWIYKDAYANSIYIEDENWRAIRKPILKENVDKESLENYVILYDEIFWKKLFSNDDKNPWFYYSKDYYSYDYIAKEETRKKFAEIISPIVDNIFSKLYEIKSLKQLNQLIYSIQLNDLQFTINNWMIDKDVLEWLITENQGSFLKITKIFLDNNDNNISFYLNNNDYFTINYSWLDIDNKYTNWIKTSHNSTGIILEWSMKLAEIIFNKDNSLIISLWNNKFNVPTDNIQLKLY